MTISTHPKDCRCYACRIENLQVQLEETRTRLQARVVELEHECKVLQTALDAERKR